MKLLTYAHGKFHPRSSEELFHPNNIIFLEEGGNYVLSFLFLNKAVRWELYTTQKYWEHKKDGSINKRVSFIYMHQREGTNTAQLETVTTHLLPLLLLA